MGSTGSAEYGGAEYSGGPQTPATTLGGSLAQNIKKEIVLNLQALVQAGVINSVLEIDKGKDVIDIQPDNGYPLALVGMPEITADFEDQATNIRTYNFKVLIAVSYEYLQDKNEGVEYIIDQVLNQFDNNFTLKGAAIATVLPMEIVAYPIASGDKTLVGILFPVRARALFQWTNPNP